MRSSQARRRKIGVVAMIDSLERPGGGERLALEGVLRLDPERFDRVLCVTRWSDEVAETEPARSMLVGLEQSGVRMIKLNRTSRWQFRAFAPLWRELRSGRIDVLHGHLIGSNLWSVIIGKPARVPVIVAHEHMWSYSPGRLRPFVDREVIARFASAFIAVSENGRRAMIDLEGIDPAEIVLLRNGIEAPREIGRTRAREKFGLAPDALVAGSIGHLRAEKAFEVMLEGLAPLCREARRPLQIVLIGEGPERERLESLAGSLGIADSVHLVGAQPEAGSLAAAFDVAVCCSDFEGGPLSVMEYMAVGAPIAATDVGGLPELLEDGAAGLLFPARSPELLRAAVQSILDDPEGAAHRSERARVLRAAEYDIGVWAERLEKLYERLLDESRLSKR